MSAQAAGEHAEPGALDAVAALLLVAALVGAVIATFHNPEAEYRRQAADGASLLEQGRYSEAQTLFEQLLPHYDAPGARLGLSYAYLARRDAPRAEIQARRVLMTASLDWQPAAWAQLGRVLAFAGKQDEASAAWRSCLEAASRYPRSEAVQIEARSSLWHLGAAAWENEDFAQARAYLERLEGQGDVYAASASLKLAQLLAPDSNDISHELRLQAEDWTSAPQEGSIGGLAIPDLGVPGLREGLSAAEMQAIIDGLSSAEADIGRLKAAGAGNAAVAAEWGRAFLQQGEPYLAKAQFERSVRLQPDFADAQAYLGLALLSMGRESDAISHLNEAERLDSDRPLPHQALARVYVSRQDWINAQAELTILKRLEPDSATVHMQLADYYVQRRAYGPAEEEYIAAVEKQRTDPNTPADLDAALALSRFYTDVRGLGCEKGLAPAQESLTRHPGDPASLDAVGWALVLCGKPAEALSSLLKAVDGAPRSPRFRYHLGRAYQLLDRPADARSEYMRVIDLDPGGSWERLARSQLPDLRD